LEKKISIFFQKNNNGNLRWETVKVASDLYSERYKQ
jgi:hypothetical protein